MVYSLAGRFPSIWCKFLAQFGFWQRNIFCQQGGASACRPACSTAKIWAEQATQVAFRAPKTAFPGGPPNTNSGLHTTTSALSRLSVAAQTAPPVTATGTILDQIGSPELAGLVPNCAPEDRCPNCALISSIISSISFTPPHLLISLQPLSSSFASSASSYCHRERTDQASACSLFQIGFHWLLSGMTTPGSPSRQLRV